MAIKRPLVKREKVTLKQIASGLEEVYDKKTEKLIGYRGFSHRGGCVFQIGDTLFDAKWKMSKTHPDYPKLKKKADKSEFGDTVESFIAFKERGSNKCKSLSDCKKAAIRFAEYIS